LGKAADYLTKHGTAIKKALALGLLVSIAPFLILTLFTQPAYDDYCFSVNARALGFADSVKNLYNTWDGKYFYSVLRYLNPVTFGSFAGYKVVALLIVLLTFTSIFCFIPSRSRSCKSLGSCSPGFLTRPSFLAQFSSSPWPSSWPGGSPP
jgi:hypothetical protein